MKIRPFLQSGSLLFFSVSFSVLLSIGLASALFGGPSLGGGGGGGPLAGILSDKPEQEGGDGYTAEDDCGFIQGVSELYSGYRVNALDVSNKDQACLDAFSGTSSGTFYDEGSRNSYITFRDELGTIITVDLSPNVSDALLPRVSLTDGKWTGYGEIISPVVPSDQKWVWFDWSCTDPSKCLPGMMGNEPNWWVKTSMENGTTTGYAWSDYIAKQRGSTNGFVQFNSLFMEVPPMMIVPYIDIEANESGLSPSMVDRDTAPQANGVDYWRVGVHFVNMLTGESLTEGDFESLEFSLETLDNVFMHQITNNWDALDVSSWHPVHCPSGTELYCKIPKEDGTITFNLFVRSYAPTSNMLWMDQKVDLVEQELVTDRDGCIWIYLDQLSLASLGASAQCKIATSGTSAETVSPNEKWDYFFGRSANRNFVEIQNFNMDIELASGKDYRMMTDSSLLLIDEDNQGRKSYQFTPSSDSEELSFSPRFVIKGLYAEYDGNDLWTSVSEDPDQEDMYLNTNAYAYPASDYLKSYLGTGLQDSFTLFYQLDAGTDLGRTAENGDMYLTLDVVDADISEVGNNVSNYRITPLLTPQRTFSSRYAMGYGHNSGRCETLTSGIGIEMSTCTDFAWTDISDPTVELWACDTAIRKVIQNRKGASNPGNSCYYVGYLPIVDRHSEVGGVIFKGSTNDFFGSSFGDDESIFKGGDQSAVLKTRNVFYELATRYTQGVSAGAGRLDLDDLRGAILGSGQKLMGDTLYYFNGDVNVESAESFNSSTLYVKGGDVYINGNIGSEGSRLGIVAFKENGVGGNVYIDPSVTDLYVNIFADGIIANQSPIYDGIYPSWLNSALRISELKNQLYINGTVSGRITMDADTIADEVGYYTCDGTEVSQSNAQECALTSLRQFRLCYVSDSDSVDGLGTVLEMCNEGESLSVYGEEYASSYPNPSDMTYYPSLILEYGSPGNLPIFTASTIFNN